MIRHYFVSDNLEDLELIERELENNGIVGPQIHVLSRDDSGVSAHHLHPVSDFMKTDVMHSGLVGMAIGLLGAGLVLATAYFNGWPQLIGWVPFVFLSVVIFGFCTWEGGFFGFQRLNARFRRFEGVLASNRHVMFLDVNPDQESRIRRILQQHPRVEAAGDGGAAPGWIIRGQNQFRDFTRWAP